MEEVLHNLPAPRSSFVGRERELVEVKRSLAMTRLLTLTGAGGSGKTRLAVEAARDLAGVYPDGVWMVELAPLSEGDLVPQAVASALGVREQPGRPLADTLVSHLRSRRLLLVLDNCEHVIDDAARLADGLLSACPKLRILATSREALRVGGEVVWRVPSLSLPEAGGPAVPEELVRYESVRLFAERARARRPGFSLDAANAGALAGICCKLDGSPLAIELAAARIGTLAVEQIAERLEDSLKLLTSGGRTVEPRQQTLRATLDWSHELLSEAERALLRRLSVFAGGFTLEAAEAICSAEHIEEGEVMDLLSRTVDKSLAVARERGGEMRYRLLEPVRQYASERLEESGEAKTVRRHHADFFLTLTQEVEPKSNYLDRRAWLERVEIEHDNLRVALRWAIEAGEAETALRLARGAFWFWHMRRGYVSEGRGWFERVLALVPGRTTPVRAEALFYAGYLAWIKGDYLIARSQLEESVAIRRELEGEQGGLANALWLLGLVKLTQGETIAARSLAEESVKTSRTTRGDEFGLSRSLAILGIVVLSQGDHALATSLLEESAAISRKMGDDWFLSLPTRYIGIAALRLGDHDRAVACIKESLDLLRESGEKWYISRSLECLAAVDAIRGDYGRAARLFGAGEALREAISASQLPFYLVDYDRGVAAARAELGEDAFAAAWAEGRAMTLDQSIDYAFSAEASPATGSAPEDLPDQLTRREEEVAALVARGLTNRRIASELSISVRTVENHVANILKKLGLRSRAQIYARAKGPGEEHR